MKRYDLITNYRCGDAIEEMEPADDGEWVRYEEVAGILAGYEQRMRLIQWWSQSTEEPPASLCGRSNRSTERQEGTTRVPTSLSSDSEDLATSLPSPEEPAR